MSNEKMEHWFDYYKLQYDRVAQHENQRLLVTNFIVAISTAIFLLGTKIDGMNNLYYITILSIIVIALNTLAIQFINKSRYWVKFHQFRAKIILHHNDEKMLKVINQIKKRDSNKDKRRRPQLLKGIHYILIILALAYPFIALNITIKSNSEKKDVSNKNSNCNDNITSTRRPIIYPSGKIIAHDSRYIQKFK